MSWVIQLLIATGVVFALSVVSGKILKKAEAIRLKSDLILDKVAIKTLISTKNLYFSLMLSVFYLKVINKEFQINWFVSIELIQHVALIFIMCITFVIFSKKVETEVLLSKVNRGEKFDEITVSAMGKIARLIIYIISLVMALQSFGVSLSGVLAITGAGTLVLGYAMKDNLANVFSTIAVYTDRNFAIGDRVTSSDRKIDGWISEIGWRQTKIISVDKDPMYVPNALWSTIIVRNLSRMTHRLIEENINLTSKDVNSIIESNKLIREMAEKHPAIDLSQNIIVALDGFSEIGYKVRVRLYMYETDLTKFSILKEEFLAKILDVYKSNKIDVSFVENIGISSSSKQKC